MSKKNKNIKGESYNKKSLIKAIMGIFSADPAKSLNYKQLSQDLGIKDVSSKRLVNEVLYELADQGLLKEVYRGKFKVAVLATEMEGVVRIESDGNGYVVTDDGQEISISEYNLNHALHGDRVKVALVVRHRKKRTEAEVVDVIERANRTYVGRIEMEPNYAFVVPVGKIMPYDVFIPKGAMSKAKDGQKVIVRITDWPLHTKSPVGEVVEVLGDPGVHEVEMHAILAEFDLPYGFPKELDAYAAKISDKIAPKDIEQRRDFRDVLTITIDPVDAKDFDDALSLKQIDDDTFEVGVHIADVTHYVRPGSPLTLKRRIEPHRFIWWTDAYPCCPKGSQIISARFAPTKRSFASRQFFGWIGRERCLTNGLGARLFSPIEGLPTRRYKRLSNRVKEIFLTRYWHLTVLPKSLGPSVKKQEP